MSPWLSLARAILRRVGEHRAASSVGSAEDPSLEGAGAGRAGPFRVHDEPRERDLAVYRLVGAAEVIVAAAARELERVVRLAEDGSDINQARYVSTRCREWLLQVELLMDQAEAANGPLDALRGSPEAGRRPSSA